MNEYMSVIKSGCSLICAMLRKIFFLNFGACFIFIILCSSDARAGSCNALWAKYVTMINDIVEESAFHGRIAISDVDGNIEDCFGADISRQEKLSAAETIRVTSSMLAGRVLFVDREDLCVISEINLGKDLIHIIILPKRQSVVDSSGCSRSIRVAAEFEFGENNND